MVYTYDSIMDEARKAGVLEKFSQEDHNAAQKNPEYGMSLVGLLKDANNATTDAQRLLATETLNKLRKSYGVTGAAGTSSGNSFTGAQRLAAPEKTGTLASSDPTTYQAVLDDIVNQKDFTYDHEQDPVYKAYEQKYQREGERASENVLAQLAAMTGGRPSSYAISAAQQAGNEYAAALADMIPTLRQNALAEHQNKMGAKYDILSALQNKQQTDYQKVLDDENRKRLAIQDALTKYQVLGYATPDVAELLGIMPGIPKGQYTVANQSGKVDGTTKFMVGNSLLTQEEIDQAIAANAIKADYDIKTGKVTYSWAQGMESEPDIQSTEIVNEMGGSGNDAWILVGTDKLSWDQLIANMENGTIAARIDPTMGGIRYVWKNQTGPKLAINGGGQMLLK